MVGVGALDQGFLPIHALVILLEDYITGKLRQAKDWMTREEDQVCG